MATVTYHSAVLNVDNGIGGTPTAYSSQCTKIATTLKVNAAEHWTFGTRDSQRSVGGKSHEIKPTVRVETTATSFYGILMAILESGTLATYNGTLTYQLGVPDFTSSGSHTWTGECKVVGAGDVVMGEAGKGEVQTCDFTLGTDGAVTYAVVA
jgi:hypothetical protein